MDEIPLTFNCPPNKTVHFKGDKTVRNVTTGNEKTSFICVLACAANGQKLKSLLIFKRKTHPKDNFTNDVVVTINKKGWMCEAVMIEWLVKVWCKTRCIF